MTDLAIDLMVSAVMRLSSQQLVRLATMVSRILRRRRPWSVSCLPVQMVLTTVSISAGNAPMHRYLSIRLSGISIDGNAVLLTVRIN